MKLLSCHVDNFGKLSNLNMDFSEGVNVFHEPNAWGKSTLAAFLRVMFYGFDSKRESGLFDKERVVYRPWQGGTYGGEVDFSYKDKSYRISRTFGKTEKTDEFRLYDLSTNLECHDFSSEIGSEIFGLDSASFKRSIFIAQNDCECASTDAINAKLGNLVENTNDINNFESAQKRIHERMNKLSPERATGSIKKRRNSMTLLTEELRSFEAAETAAKEISGKLSDKQKQRKELLDIRGQYARALQTASEESRRDSLKENYRSLCSETAQRKQELDSYRKIFPERVPEDEEFVQKNQEVQMLGVLRTTLHNLGLTDEERIQYSKLSEMFGEGTPTERDLQEAERQLERLGRLREEKAQLETKISYFEAMAIKQEQPTYSVKKRTAMLVLGIFLILAGFIGAVAAILFMNPVQISAIAVAAAVAVLGGIVLIVREVLISREEQRIRKLRSQQLEETKKLREPVEEIQKTMAAATAEIKRIEDNSNAFFECYHKVCGSGDSRTELYELRSQLQDYERLKTREMRSVAAQEEFDRTRESLLVFSRETGIDFGEDIAGGISQMQMKAAEYRLAEKNYSEAVQRQELFEQEYNIEELSAIEKCPYSLDELNGMIYDVDERLEDVRQAVEQYHHQMEDLQEQLDVRDEKEQQLAICREEQDHEKHLYKILGMTQKFLQRAKDQFSARYMGPIEGGFSKYYERLTGDRSGNWMVNANISVQVKQEGQMRETKCLSAGYQDLLGVCMRLALVDAMYPDEKPFLVLDDPFVNLDEEKVVHGNELLRSIAEEYQILYFTCNSSRNLK